MTEIKEIRRNESFDILKGIACIAVVLMHCEFPGPFGVIVQCLTRWSVPLFFGISGYFFRKDTTEECLRKAKGILKITVVAVLFYTVFGIAEHMLLGDLSEYVGSEMTLMNIASFVLLNSPVFINGHLWFLFALIYVYLSYAILIKLDLMKYRRALCAVLICMHFIIAYGSFIIGKSLPGGAYRNFIFEGIPFFLFGNLFYQNGLKNKADGRYKNIRGGIFIAAGALLSLAERYILGRDFSVHIGSVIVLFGLFLAASADLIPRKLKAFSVLGNRYSMFVYIIHPAVFKTFDGIFHANDIDDLHIISWIRPINTLIMTILISMAIFAVLHRKREK